MKLKGSATIELTNADGSKEVIEHDNMITNAVNDLLYVARGEQSNIMRIANNGERYVESLFGGIILFKDELNDDPDDYYIPSVRTTGYASLSSYGGLDIERGGFNQSESGMQEDGSYKFVWDFSTSQANGEIKAIGLCPSMMGKVGMSNATVSSEKLSLYVNRPAIAPFDTNCNLLPRSGDTEGFSNYGYNIVAVDGNIAYALHVDNLNANSGAEKGFVKNGGILKVFRFDVGMTGIGLKSKVGCANYIDCIDVKLPDEFLSTIQDNGNDKYGINYSYDDVRKRIIIYPCNRSSHVNEKETIKYVEIEIENNMNVITRSFTNNAPGYIFMSGSYGYQQPAYSDYGNYTELFILNDYIVSQVVVEGKRKIYVTNKEDNTDIKEVKYEDGREYSYSVSWKEYYCRIRNIFTAGNLFAFGYSADSAYTSFSKACVIDLAKGLLKEINVENMTYRSNIPLANKVTFGRTGTYLALSITINPFVLTTKNNLGTPVTKTASQTMKITYTLTESEGA